MMANGRPEAQGQPRGWQSRRDVPLQAGWPAWQQPAHRRRGRQQAAASAWLRSPEPPAKYRATARLSDMFHGWLDGKRGVPLLPEQPDGPPGRPSGGGLATAPDADHWQASSLGGAGLVDPAAALVMPGEVPSWTVNGEMAREDETETPGKDAPVLAAKRLGPWTPRMEILVLQAHERMEEEQIRLAEDLTLLRERAIGAWQSVEALTEQVKAAGQALERARVPLGAQERVARRFAEQDPQERPEQLVIGRRDAAWTGRLRLAEQQHQTATAELARAGQLLRTHQDAVSERIAVARAAARRQHELGSRRVATYLQQLVRTHAHGRQLNDLFMEHRVGPELPDWTKNQAEEGRS